MYSTAFKPPFDIHTVGKFPQKLLKCHFFRTILFCFDNFSEEIFIELSLADRKTKLLDQINMLKDLFTNSDLNLNEIPVKFDLQLIGGQYGTGFLRDQEKIPLRERDRPIRARDHYQNGTIDTFTGLGNYQNGTRNNTNGIDTFTRLTHTGSMPLRD